MFEIGRLCFKIAGRDAGLRGVIVDIIDDNYVLLDGEVRRRKCNIKHLEPTDKVLKINKGASFEEVAKAFKEELNVELKPKNSKPQKDKPTKVRKSHQKEEKQKKEKKKKEKKVEVTKEEPEDDKKEEKAQKDTEEAKSEEE